MMKFHAVIFDLDGTLLDTIDDIADAVNFVLSNECFPVHSVEFYKEIIGAGVEDLVKRSLPEKVATMERISSYTKLIRQYYRTRGLVKTKPYDGIEDLLGELALRKIKFAVLSNKPHENAVNQISHFFSQWHFESVNGARQGFSNKPDPTEVLKILSDMGVKPSESIFLGDTDVDMQTAKAAGMYAVGALWGFRPGKELKDNGAQALIEKPTNLLELFN